MNIWIYGFIDLWILYGLAHLRSYRLKGGYLLNRPQNYEPFHI